MHHLNALNLNNINRFYIRKLKYMVLPNKIDYYFLHDNRKIAFILIRSYRSPNTKTWFYYIKNNCIFIRLYELYRLLADKITSSYIAFYQSTLFFLIHPWRCSFIFFAVFSLVSFSSPYMSILFSTYFHRPAHFILIPLINFTTYFLL